MKKPISLKIIIFLLGLQLLLIVFILVVAFVASIAPSTSGFWFGLEDSIARHAGAESLADFNAEHFGRVLGAYLIPLVLNILALAFITYKKRTAVFICLLLSLMAGLGGGGFPLLIIISLVLFYLPGPRNYFKVVPPPPPITSS